MKSGDQLNENPSQETIFLVTTLMVAMLSEIVFHCRRRRANAPTINATSHVNHVKRGAWFSISINASGSVPIVRYSALLRIWAAGAPQ